MNAYQQFSAPFPAAINSIGVVDATIVIIARCAIRLEGGRFEARAFRRRFVCLR